MILQEGNGRSLPRERAPLDRAGSIPKTFRLPLEGHASSCPAFASASPGGLFCLGAGFPFQRQNFSLPLILTTGFFLRPRGRPLAAKKPFIPFSVMIKTLLGLVAVTLATAVGFSAEPFTTYIQITGPASQATRIRVSRGDTVVLARPDLFNGEEARWVKNGTVVLPSAPDGTLILKAVRAEDAGSYALYNNNLKVMFSHYMVLSVTTEPILSNFSARIKLASGGDTQICGFVIAGDRSKEVLIRAVGGSLKKFGVENVVARPRFRLYRADGVPVSLSSRQVAPPKSYWNDVFATTGAFPLDGNEEPLLSYDVGTLSPGAYTIQVTDEARAGGEVLVEVYEYLTRP